MWIEPWSSCTDCYRYRTESWDRERNFPVSRECRRPIAVRIALRRLGLEAQPKVHCVLVVRFCACPAGHENCGHVHIHSGAHTDTLVNNWRLCSIIGRPPAEESASKAPRCPIRTREPKGFSNSLNTTMSRHNNRATAQGLIPPR